MSDARFLEIEIDTKAVPGPRKAGILLPPGFSPSEGPLPVLFLLHGGMGYAGRTSMRAGLLEQAWTTGVLPRLIVVTPDADRSFYLTSPDGKERWEEFVLSDVPDALRQHFATSKLLMMGISMGGMGALRFAFKNPSLFTAVAALEPAIEPALSFFDIEERDLFYRKNVYPAKFGVPVDDDFWQANNPANLALANGKDIRRSGLEIYLEVGDADVLGLYRGAEFLHRILYDNDIAHEYRLVRKGDHVGRTVPPRFMNAFDFLRRVLKPDPGVDPAVDEFIAKMEEKLNA